MVSAKGCWADSEVRSRTLGGSERKGYAVSMTILRARSRGSLLPAWWPRCTRSSMAEVYVQVQGLEVWLARPRLPTANVAATSQSSAPIARPARPGRRPPESLPAGHAGCDPGTRPLDAALPGQAGLLERGDTVPAGWPLSDGGGELQRPFRAEPYLGRTAGDRERSDSSSGETARNRTARPRYPLYSARSPGSEAARAGGSQQ